MTREEVSARFNALPREHRTTMIGYELYLEIKWLEGEKRDARLAHEQNLKRLNDRIKVLNILLNQLRDERIEDHELLRM